MSISDAPESPSLDLGGLPDLLGFQLRMAHVAMHRDFVAAMTDLGLTQKQFATLRLIIANPGVSQADLAAILGTDRATMMALVDRLDHRELVERRRSTTDRRRQELYLTAAGKSFMAKAERVLDGHERRFTSMFSEKELRAFIAALARMHGDRDLTP